MKEAFKHVDTGETNHLDASLEKDAARRRKQILIEVYRRLRPGNLATVDNARGLIENMFYNFKRFDFFRVGRYRNQQATEPGRTQHH
ncbi:MAG: hypothetical protein U5L95_00130 [Candidatus Saccharibacteria bacterium]|nr:hypothetical protein [Candidatus Saccharibacteria bacterium]